MRHSIALGLLITIQTSAAMAQGTPRWTVTMGGSSLVCVTPGDWSGTLTAHLNTAGHELLGWQGALQSTDNSVFKFGNPTVTMLAPGFAQDDIVFDATQVGGPLGTEVSVFALSGADRPALNQAALSFNVMTTRSLVIGEAFDFFIAESNGQPGHFLTNSTPEGAVGIPFADPIPFTLHFCPEPTSALLVLTGLALVTRRASPRRCARRAA